MNRRELMLLGGAAVAWPPPARAQQKAIPVIGFLSSISRDPVSPFLAAFHQGLSETGYVEGQNLTVEYRWAEGHYDQLPGLAHDLVGQKVNVILAMGDEPARIAKGATATIPIAFITGADPTASVRRAGVKALRATVRVSSPRWGDRLAGEPDRPIRRRGRD